MSDQSLHYSRGRNIHDNQPAQRQAADFGALVAALERDRAPVKAGAGYIAGPLNGHGRRCAEGATARRWLAVDLDRIEADLLPDLRLWFARFSGCGWPTHSSTPEAPRERVIIELDREATRAECIEVGRVLMRDLTENFGQAVLVDASTFRGEQPVFLPPAGVRLARFDGEPLAVDAYLQAAQELPPVAPERPTVNDQGARGATVAAGRNEALSREAYRLRKLGCSVDQVDEVLQAMNRAICSPPLDGDEVRGIAQRKARVSPDPQNTDTAPAAPGIPVEWAKDLPTELHAPQQIVEGVLLAGGMSMIYGESNSGKSYLALHLAICVSLGQPWLGKRTQQKAVLYVAAEGAWSIRVRLAAYRQHFGRPAGSLGVVPASLSLVDPSADVEALVELVRSSAAALAEPVGLIVVDTVARVLGGGDENAAQDMGRLVSAGDYIREQTGAHILYIHHSGKDAARGARGHSSLRAALDTEIEVTADASTKVHTAKITKQRDLPSNGEQLAGRFVPVELGFDQWGGAITACAVLDAEAPAAAAGPRRLSPAQQAVLGFLAGKDAGVRRSVIVEALTPQGIARPSVYRAINDLLASGLAAVVAGLVYVVKG